MKIMEQSVELADEINPLEVLKKIERCGRVCYQSQPREDSAEQFVRMLIKRGHESVLEHVSLTFHIITNRAIQNEVVRHRIASYSVESTRYVKYSEATFVKPLGLAGASFDYWYGVVKRVEEDDHNLLKLGATPEIARDVLNLGLRSELYLTMNLRELRHFLKERTAKVAHPQMRQLAGMIYDIIKEKLPVIVEDIQCHLQ